jgi:mRNA-degrading endonuclease RelE of RelBE toxin-antitoxin system
MPLVGFSFGPAAARFLDKMPAGNVRAQIAKKARSLLTNPHPPGCKKLVGVMSGTDSVWRIRCGDYRILYVARSMEIIVLDTADRLWARLWRGLGGDLARLIGGIASWRAYDAWQRRAGSLT